VARRIDRSVGAPRPRHEARLSTPFPPTSREKLLDVAEARFAQHGLAGVGMREVAQLAGLGKSSLFHHFASKDALYHAVLDRVLARIEQRLAPALASAEPAPARLDRGVVALIDALAEHPTAARLLLRALFEDDLQRHDSDEARALDARLAGLVARIHRLLAEVGPPESAADSLQTLVGATIYYFASGEFGEQIAGTPLFSAEAVARRKREVLATIHHGLIRPLSRPEGEKP
jgi:AcrR family transcriptional regulator